MSDILPVERRYRRARFDDDDCKLQRGPIDLGSTAVHVRELERSTKVRLACVSGQARRAAALQPFRPNSDGAISAAAQLAVAPAYKCWITPVKLHVMALV